MNPPGRTGRQRVLVLTGIFPNRQSPTWGIHIFQNVRALAANADVRVVATVPGFRSSGIPARTQWEGLDVVYPRFLVVPKVARFLHGWEYYYSIRRAVVREVNDFRPDVILAYFAYPYGFAAVKLGKMFGLPVVISCRGSDVNLMTGPRLQGRMIISSLRACRRVWVMSSEMRERVLAWGLDPERVDVVSNGVDAERFHVMDRSNARSALAVDQKARMIVCVSRLGREKGIDVLVDAMARLKDDSTLYVIGDGAERAALRDRVRSAGLNERVFLRLTRPHEEIPQWLAAADLAVLPSRTEGMPNAVLEALACGRPVVATAVGGTRELVTSSSLGILVPPDEPEALAVAIRAALSGAWDENAIAASVADRTWEAVGRRAARLLEFNYTPDATVARIKSWTTGTN